MLSILPWKRNLIYGLTSLLFAPGILRAQAPVINNFSPSTGAQGSIITINGSNFSNTASQNAVFLGAVRAAVVTASSGNLTVSVPAGANYQPLTVTHLGNGLTGVANRPFGVTYPGHIGFRPQQAVGSFLGSWWLHAADLDGDGKPDLVASDYSLSRLSAFRNTSSGGNMSFAAQQDFQTASAAAGGAIADINGDGKPDVLVAQSGGGVAIFRNTSTPGSISFAPRVDVTAGQGTLAVAAGDIDGDGRLDMVAANSSAGTVSVLRNTSAGGSVSFAPKVDFTVGTTPYGVALGDVDGDGKPDIAAANEASATLSLLRNTSSSGFISFSPKTDFPVTAGPKNVFIGDVDGDGRSDLLVACSNSFTLCIFRNTSNIGNISLSGRQELSPGAAPYSVVMGDVDGDGKPDVCTSNEGGSNVGVLRNLSTPGTISLDAARVFTTGLSPNSLTAVDLNGDARMDIATLNTGSISVFQQASNIADLSSLTTSAGTLSPAFTPGNTSYEVALPQGTTSISVTPTCADPNATVQVRVNGGGFTTVTNGNPSASLPLNPGSNTVEVQVTAPDLTTTKTYQLQVKSGIPVITTFTPANGPTGTAVTISGSGFNTTAAQNAVFFGATRASVSASTSSSLSVTVPVGATYQPLTVTNLATGFTGVAARPFGVTFSGGISFAAPANQATGSSPRGLKVSDVDGDGRPDMLAAVNGGLAVWRNTGTGNDLAFATRADFPAGSATEAIAVGDLDGDGRPDVALCDGSNNTVSVFRNTSTSGNVSFAARIELALTSGGKGLALGDLNGDGRAELVAAVPGLGQLSIFPNNSTPGNISFGARVNISQPNNESLNIADLDGDGFPDMVVTFQVQGYVVVLRNTGMSTGFQFEATTLSGFMATWTEVGDLDGDGRPDLAAVSRFSSQIRLRRNTSTAGSISFADWQSFESGATSNYTLALADVDGDTRIEVVAANEPVSSVSVLRNTSVAGSLSLAAPITFSIGSNARSLALADLNADSKTDIITGKVFENNVGVLRQAVSSENRLQSLVPSQGSLTPAFQSGTLNYYLSLSSGVTSIAVTPTTVDPAATVQVRINGGSFAAVSNGVISGQLALLPGLNTVEVRVTATDGTQRSYLLSVSRGQPPAITSVSPFSGIPGSTITVSGSDFGATPAENNVIFGAVKGTVTAASSNSLTVTVPTAATFESFSVANLSTGFTGFARRPFLTTAAGSFSYPAKTDVAPGAAPRQAQLCDVDGDGKSDYVFISPGGTSVSILRNTSTGGAASFAARVDLPLGMNASALAAGDLDGDGRPDLAVVSTADGKLSVMLNNSSSGNPAFSAPVELPSGASPQFITMADMDLDGKTDLLVTHNTIDSVNIFRNISRPGQPAFAPRTGYKTGVDPVYASVADLDGDGKPDLVVSNAVGSTVWVFRNISSPGMISLSYLYATAGGSTPSATALQDLDGDGKPEILVVGRNVAFLVAYRNISSPGNIDFALPVTFPTGNTPQMLSLGDIDGDGKPDVAVTNSGGSTVSVWKNQSVPGTVLLANKLDFSTGNNPYDVELGDLDGDGRPDLAVSVPGAGNVSVLLQGGLSGNANLSSLAISAGTLAPAFSSGTTNYTAVVSSATGSITVTPVAAQANATLQVRINGGAYSAIASGATSAPLSLNVGSNTIDVLVTAQNTVATQLYQVVVQREAPPAAGVPLITSFTPVSGPPGTAVTLTGSGFHATAQQNMVFFGATRATVTAASPTSLTVTVPGGSTYQPISVTNLETAATGYSLRPFNVTASGALTFKTAVVAAVGSGPQLGTLYDWDGDGKPDVAMANRSANTVSLLRNTSAAGTTAFAAKTDLVTGSSPNTALAGDFDRDGKPDLVVLNQSSNSFSIFRSTSTTGNIAFAAKVDVTTGTNPYHGAVADIDGDGRPDLISANYSIGNISVFRNTTSGSNISFSAPLNFSAGSGPAWLAVGDVDGDGKPDIVAANLISSNISVWRNTSTAGNISLVDRQNVTTSTNPYAVGLVDLDGDGKLDLVSSCEGNNTVALHRNLSAPGAISFGTIANFATGAGPRTLSFGDVDGDGKPDVVTGNWNAANISVLRNTSIVGTLSLVANQLSTDVGPRINGVGDVDGDGQPDLMVSNGFGSSISIMPQNSAGTPPPAGAATQYFCAANAPTVANLSATGTDIKWYSNASGGTALPANTPLSNGTVYHASQTVGGVESTTRLAVTVVFDPTSQWLGINAQWSDPQNWSTGQVPTACTRVVVNGGVPFMPTISGTGNTCFSINLAPGINLQVAPGASLLITGR